MFQVQQYHPKVVKESNAEFDQHVSIEQTWVFDSEEWDCLHYDEMPEEDEL